MKIELIINADFNKELFLHENSDELKDKLLNVIEQFVGKDTCVDYYQEDAQIDAVTGNVVNYNPYPFKFHYKEDLDINYLAAKHPVIIV